MVPVSGSHVQSLRRSTAAGVKHSFAISPYWKCKYGSKLLIISLASASSSGRNWKAIPWNFPLDLSTEWNRGNLLSVVDMI